MYTNQESVQHLHQRCHCNPSLAFQGSRPTSFLYKIIIKSSKLYYNCTAGKWDLWPIKEMVFHSELITPITYFNSTFSSLSASTFALSFAISLIPCKRENNTLFVLTCITLGDLYSNTDPHIFMIGNCCSCATMLVSSLSLTYNINFGHLRS